MSALSCRPIAEIIEDNTADFFLGLGRADGSEVCDRRDVKYVFAGSGYNRVLCSRFPASEADAVVGRVVARLDALGIDALWYLGPAAAPGLGGILAEYGFTYQKDWKSMAIGLAGLLAGSAAPRGLEIRPAESTADLDDWAEVVVASFGIDDDVHRGYGRHLIAGAGAGNGRRRYFLGWLGGRPVATAALFHGTGAAGLYWVGTLPEARDRGIATAMTWHPLRASKASGHHMAVLNASAAGHPLYRQIGFTDYHTTAIYHRKAR